MKQKIADVLEDALWWTLESLEGFVDYMESHPVAHCLFIGVLSAATSILVVILAIN